jgi:hypothetical protein
MKFVNQAVAVEARFETDGKVRPRRFARGGTWLYVSDVGRQWVEADGRHVLVMAAGQRTFELLLERESLCWRVVRETDVKSKA